MVYEVKFKSVILHFELFNLLNYFIKRGFICVKLLIFIVQFNINLTY